MVNLVRRSLAEMLGTFIFVLFGPGSVVAFMAAFQQPLDPETLFFSGATFGLGIAMAIIAVGPISGGHVNPAVTLGLFFAGKFNGKDVLPYIVAQLIGAVLASSAISLMFGYSVADSVQFGATIPGAGDEWKALFGEFLMTFIFLWVISSIVKKSDNIAVIGIVIGIYVAIMIYILGTISGGSINPARSFGPAVLSGILLNGSYYQWIYWVGPVFGGITGALSYNFLYGDKRKIYFNSQ